MKIPIDKRPENRFEWSETLNAWMVHKYEDVFAVLISQQVSAAAGSQPMKEESLPLTDDESTSRNEVIIGFNRKAEKLSVIMEDLAAAHCSSVAGKSSFDLQQELVYPWCFDLGFGLLGIEPTDDQKTEWLNYADGVFRVTEGTDRKQVDAATAFLAAEFMEIIHRRRGQPQNDFISAFVDNDLPVGVMLSPVIQLFVGVTTSLPLLLGNVFSLLLSYPPLLEEFKKNANKQLNELIRLAGPTQYVYRVVLSDLQIGDRLFKRGDRLAVYLSLANYDARYYPAPETVNCTRDRKGHMSLGMGWHACLGAPLIRKAVWVLTEAVFEALSGMALREVEWGGSRAVRGAVRLQVDIKNP